MGELSGTAWTIISILAGILATAIVALIVLIVQLRSTWPRLRGAGGGTGSMQAPNNDLSVSTLTIMNDPAFFGMKLARETANIQSARLYDQELQQFVGHSLLWEDRPSQKLQHTVTIPPAENRTIFVFAKECLSDGYFIYDKGVIASPDRKGAIKFSARKKDFLLEIRDTIGRVYRFAIVANNRPQFVSVGFKLTIADRRRMIGRALRLILRAFSAPSA